MGSALRSYSRRIQPRERADEGVVGRSPRTLTAFHRQPWGPIIACSLITWDVTSFIVCGPANRLQGTGSRMHFPWCFAGACGSSLLIAGVS